MYIVEKRCLCSRTKQSSKLKWNGSTFSLMMLHGRWWIRCELCILPCLLVEAKQLWYGGLVYALWWFGICLDMVFSICFDTFFGIWFGICFWYIFLAIFLYVHVYMDVNTTMSYVIKLHYAIWVLCHYDYVVMLLCYHVVMLSWCYDVMWVGTQ